MKQSITPEQWESIGKGHQDTFTKAIYPSAVVEMFGVRIDEEYPSIGQMIQFLGEDLHSLMFMSPVWTIGGKFGAKQGKELVDVLFKAVKVKLNA